MYAYRKAELADLTEVIQLWERSVKATHDFLDAEGILAIKDELIEFIPQQELILVTEKNNQQILGFASVAAENLNMLFLDESAIGKGIGSQLFDYMLEHYPFKTLDVNKDNPYALAFYLHKGFEVIAEEPVDEQGRPFPILKLAKK